MAFVRISALVAGAAVALLASPIGVSTAGARGAASATGSIRLDGGAGATRSAEVIVTVPPPTDSSNLLRLSDDGGTSWVVRAWTTTLRWSLVDASAGGDEADGRKTVTVEGGGEGTWTPLGADSILLDRTGPAIGTPTLEHGQRVQDFLHLAAGDDGVGLDRTEVSLDGKHWRSLMPNPFGYQIDGFLDLRESLIGGTWTPGMRTIFSRAVDRLGNVSEAPPIEDDVEVMRTGTDVPADFTFPHAAVTGRPFTIDPTFDAGFHVPAKLFCNWNLKWGDQAVRLEGKYDVTLGSVSASVRPNSDGTCDPWTFTLPYSDPQEYTWGLTVGPTEYETYHDGMAGVGSWWTGGLAGTFRAGVDGTSRAITHSTVPLLYLLPDDDYAGDGSVITYRLHSVGGASTAGGSWACMPSDGTPQSAFTAQKGGDLFACPVATSEPYTAVWDKSGPDGDWRAFYDPIGDVRRPTITSLHVEPAPGGTVSRTAVRLRLDWSGTDRGSGVRRFVVQLSRDGRAWRSLPLASRRATQRSVTGAVTSAYRFRVRAIDRAGNVSEWHYSPTVRPAVFDDRSTRAHWSVGWHQASSAGALGGRLHRAAHAARVSFRFTGRAVGLLAPRGASAGYAQILVDGRLVATLDLRGRATPPRIAWATRWRSSGRHVITVRGLGTRGRPTLAVDGFAVVR